MQTYGSGWTATYWPTYSYTPGCSSSCSAASNTACGLLSTEPSTEIELPYLDSCFTASSQTASTLNSSLTSNSCGFDDIFCQVIISFFALSQ